MQPGNWLMTGKTFTSLPKKQFHTSSILLTLKDLHARTLTLEMSNHKKWGNVNAICIWATIFSSGEKYGFSGRRWLQGDWRVLPSGRSCLPRTADRRLPDSGLALRWEGGVLPHPRCQETTECPVIRPCHRVPSALSASTLEKKDSGAHLPVQRDKRHIIHDLNPPDNGIALKVNAATSCSLPTACHCWCLGRKNHVAARFFN